MVAYSKHLVAFVDVLGTRAAVKSATAEKIYGALKEFQRRLQPDPSRKRAYGLKTAAFSDSFVVACPFSVPLGQFGQFYEFFRLIGWAQFRLATAGIFVRGAITVGDLYMKGPMLFGPAIEEAAGLEGETKMPVVVVSQGALRAYNSHERVDDPVERVFWRDFDWVFFRSDKGGRVLNYLGVARYEDITTGDFDYLLRDHRNGVAAWLKEFNDPKSLYIADYHNQISQKFFPDRPDLQVNLSDMR